MFTLATLSAPRSRFAHIDGRIASNPAQYVRRPKVQPSDRAGMDRSQLGALIFTAERFDHDHATLAALLGLNGLASRKPAASTSRNLAPSADTEHYGSSAKTNKPALIPLVSRPARTIDVTIGERTEGPILRRRDG